MEKERFAKRVYVGECAGSCLMGRPRKRWSNSVKDCLGKQGEKCKIGVDGGDL